MKLGEKYCLEWSSKDDAYYVVIDGIREDDKKCEFKEQYGVKKLLTKDYLFTFDNEELNNIESELIYIFPLCIVDHPRYSVLCRKVAESHKLAEIHDIRVMILGNTKIWEPLPCVKLVFSPEKRNTVDLYSFRDNVAHQVEYSDILENNVINPYQYPRINEKYNNSNKKYEDLNNILTIEEFTYQTFLQSNPILYFILNEKGYIIPAEENAQHIKEHHVLWYIYWKNNKGFSPFCHEYIANLINIHHDQIIYGTPHNIQGDLIRYERILHITARWDLSEDAQYEYFNAKLANPEEKIDKSCDARKKVNKILSDIPNYELNSRMNIVSADGSECRDFEDEINKYNNNRHHGTLCDLYSILHSILQRHNTSETCTWLYNISYQNLTYLHDAVFFILSSDCFSNIDVLEKIRWSMLKESNNTLNNTLSRLPICGNKNNKADLLKDVREIKEKLTECESNISNGISSLICAYLNKHFIIPLEEIVFKGYEEETMIEREKALKAQQDIETRQRILSEMSHSIKNLVTSVTDPLLLIENEIIDDYQHNIIKNAMLGASLISELAQGIHLSFRKNDNWKDDITKPEQGSLTLKQIVERAFRYSIPLMFEGKYFQKYVRNYFADSLDRYLIKKTEWQKCQSLDDIIDFLNSTFLTTTVNFEANTSNWIIGDKNGTAVKFLIMFQELFLNALKYASFIEQENRSLKILIDSKDNSLLIEIQNTFLDEPSTKNENGVGHLILDNFIKMFGGNPKIEVSNGLYTISFSIVCK